MTPDWFIKACRKVLMWDDSGRDIDPLANQLWAEVGHRFSEDEIKVRGELVAVSDFHAKGDHGFDA